MARPPVQQARVNQPRPGGQIVRETEQTFMAGPLPAPQILSGYDQLVPGSAERIIAMAEREQQHRFLVERNGQAADISHRDVLANQQSSNASRVFIAEMVGQVSGAVIALAAIAAAVYTALTGAHWTVPLGLLSLPLGAIIHAVRGSVKPREPRK